MFDADWINECDHDRCVFEQGPPNLVRRHRESLSTSPPSHAHEHDDRRRETLRSLP